MLVPKIYVLSKNKKTNISLYEDMVRISSAILSLQLIHEQQLSVNSASIYGKLSQGGLPRNNVVRITDHP